MMKNTRTGRCENCDGKLKLRARPLWIEATDERLYYVCLRCGGNTSHPVEPATEQVSH